MLSTRCKVHATLQSTPRTPCLEEVPWQESSHGCFAKTTTMHDLVIGLFINRYEFGVSV